MGRVLENVGSKSGFERFRMQDPGFGLDSLNLLNPCLPGRAQHMPAR